MPRYWVIAPFESNPAESFEKVWQYDLANELISIGWSRLGDVSTLSRDQLSSKVAGAYSDKPRATQTLYANMIWNFFHEITPGDLVIARRGRKALAAVGRVTSRPFYANRKNPAAPDHSSYLPVAWQEKPRDKVFPDIVFPMHTLAELGESEFSKFAEGTQPLATARGVEDPSEFVLEKYLEDFIVTNFEAIFKSFLQIYRDPDGHSGQQYTTDVGPIDILAFEPRTKNFVVIELKKGRPSDQVVGQILRYMGWVSRNLAEPGALVKGLIICREEDPKLSYALAMVANVSIKYYSVSFRLHDRPASAA